MPRILALLRAHFCAGLLAVAAFGSASRADAQAPWQGHFYISVHDAFDTLDTPKSEHWMRGQCEAIHAVILKSEKSSFPKSECGVGENRKKLNEVRGSGQYAYLITSTRTQDGVVHLGVEQTAGRIDETDFSVARWQIETDTTPERQRANVEKKVSGFFEFARSRRLAREYLLVNGLRDSQAISLAPDGEYVDARHAQGLPFENAWSAFRDESIQHKHYLRAGLELFALLGIGQLEYFVTSAVGNSNHEDWDLKYDWPSLRSKLTGKSVTFDTNPFNINAITHPLAGSFYYLAGRTNNLNPLESTLMAIGASTLWEFLGEYREKASINDMILTPVAGAVIGEVLNQLSTFFAQGKDSALNRILSGTFSAEAQVNQWIDKNRPKGSGNLDSSGFTRDIWHQFDFFSAIGTTSVSGSGAAGRNGGQVLTGEIGIRTEIISVPGYGRPGEISKFYTDGNFTQLMSRIALGEKGLQEFQAYFRAAMAGYYRQKLTIEKSGSLAGYSFFVGEASGFEYAVHDRSPTGAGGGDMAHDQLAIVNVLGPRMDLVVYMHGFRVRASIDVFGDFALVRSYAVDEYRLHATTEGMKDILQQQSYYYAFGVTLSGRVVANYQGFEGGVEVQFDDFGSIQGHDRFQSQVTRDDALSDRRERIKAWIGYILPGDWMKIDVSYTRLFRKGTLDDAIVSRADSRLMGGLTLLF